MPYQLYINGAWRDGRQGKTIEIEDPATGEFFATSAYGDVEDAIDAMDAAASAFPGWKNKTAYERGALMDKAAALIRERAKEISHVLTRENGKPFSESMTETIGCAMWFEWFAEEGKRVYGRMIPSHFGHKRHWVIQQPVGVVVAVNPWNFPINLMCRKLAGALAAGCTIVSRPASQTPLSSMLLYECLHDAGFPPGVVNLVTGSAAKVTTAMLEHPACRKLTFTGSTATGKQLMQQAGARITKLSLELGGHAPLLVFPDVKLESAVEQTVIGKFRNGGQSCIAPTRIYVKPLLELAKVVPVHSFAHITGGGLTENIPRVLPHGLEVMLSSKTWQQPAVFSWLQKAGSIPEAEMYRTFNCGIGMTVCVAAEHADKALRVLGEHGEKPTVIGEVRRGDGGVVIRK